MLQDLQRKKPRRVAGPAKVLMKFQPFWNGRSIPSGVAFANREIGMQSR